MAEMYFDRPTNRAMGAGLRVPSAGFGDDPATRTGLGSLQATGADAVVSGRTPMQTETQALGAMRQPGAGSMANARQMESILSAPPVAPPATTERPPATVYFNQATNEMFAGDRVFKADDATSALQAAAQPANTTRPEGQGWTSLPEGSFQEYIASFSERRSTGELLGRGVKNVAYGLGTLPGTLTSLAGFEETGAALRAPVESLLGDSDNERLRSALIAENSTLWEKVVDASIESIPFLLTSFAGGAGGASLAGRGAGLTEAAVRAAKTKGAMRGATYVNLPTHLASMYDAAVQNGQDLSSLDTKAFILGGALANTAIERFGIEGRLFSPAVKDAVAKSAMRTVRDRLAAGALVGLQEAGTEVFQTATETLLFDPEVRDRMTPQDWKTILPYALETYGESYLVAAGAGALLGGGVGTILPQGAAAPRAETPVDTNRPLDLNQTATVQSAAQEAAPVPALPVQGLGPVVPNLSPEETQLTADWQSNAVLGPAVPALGESEQALASQWQTALGPMQLTPGMRQAAAATDTARGRMLLTPETRVRPIEEVVTGEPANPLLLAPEMRQRQAEAAAGRPENMILRPSQRVDDRRPMLLAPSQLVQPAVPEAAPAPGRALLTQRQRVGEAPTVPMMAPVPEVRPGAMLLRNDQRVAPEAPASPVAPAAPPKAVKSKALTKKQRAAEKKLRAIIARLATLTQEQEVALLAALDVDAQGLAALIYRDPDTVGAAIDAVVTPPTEPPPAPTTPTGKARVQRKGAEAPAAPKQAAVQRGKTAKPKPRAEAAPEPGPAAQTGGEAATRAQNAVALLDRVEGGTRARTPRLSPAEVAARRAAERGAPTAADTRVALTREQALARNQAEQAALPGAAPTKGLTPAQQEAQRLDEELDQYIEDLAAAESDGQADGRDAALYGIAAIANGKTPRGLRETDPELALAYRNRLGRAKEFLRTLPAVDQTYAKELYDKYKAIGSVPEMQAAGEALSEEVGGASPIQTLNIMLDAYTAHRTSGAELPPKFMTSFRETAIAVKGLGADGRAAMRGNNPLLAYINGQNEPNWQRGALTARTGGFALADWNTLEGAVDLDGKPVAPIAPGRVELIVRSFAAKLARKPTITVARNQADLKAKNPALYAKAVAARPQGDFDTAAAMGYSFGDGQVVLFTDRIGTEQQLNFVLAHETLGHFGLRGIMPGPKFDALMETVYAGSPGIRTAVDAAMSTRPNLSRAEAVEEYLSDYAAVLETNVVARVWNSIKGILNKLGIRTGDEMTRYLLDQARRYVRYGSGVTFDAAAVGRKLHAVESMGDTGRFSLGQSLRDINRSAALQMDSIGGLPPNFQDAWQDLKRQGVNSAESWDKFKATFLSLANFRSRQNPGLLALEKLLDEARNLSMATKVEFNERLALILNRAIAGEVGGISDEQTARINQMLYSAQRFNVAEVQKVGDLGNAPLFRMVNGKMEIDPAVLGPLQQLGTRTFQQMRDGFEYDVTFDEAGQTVTKKEKFAGIPGLTEQSIEWRGYQKIRAAMDEIELRLLKARYEGSLQERDLAFKQIAATVPDGELTADERAALTALAQTYGSLYTSNVTQDETGRAVLDADYQVYANDILRVANSALIGKDSDRFDQLRTLLTTSRQFMKGETTDLRRELPAAMEAQAADDLVARLQGFKSRMRVDQDRFVVQNKVKQVILAELASKDADKFTKRTIATGYTPVLREGAYQMRVEAFVGGKVVRLQDSYREQLVYSQFENAAQAMEMVDKTNALFGGNKFDVMYYDPDAGEYVSGKVELRAVSEAALDSIAAPPQLNLNEFIRGLRQFDIALSPEKMEDVIVALTKQNSAARNRLERVFTPGADMDGIMATMRHIESRASTISKVVVRPRLGELMDRSMSTTMSLWNGDAAHLSRLKERAEAAASDATLSREAKVDAQREYEQYAYMYEQTNPGGGKPRKGNQFYNEAARTVAFLDGNQNVDESDFGSGPMVSRIRAATSMMQLGGSIATGALNVLSVYTNGVPYLSSYNPKTSFGGGFSVGNVMAELHIAAGQVGGPGITSGEMNTAEFYDKVSKDPALQKRYKLKAHEAAFISREILDGSMIPAQSNALVGTARGRSTKGWQQKFLDGWMWTFNVTEQASRRTLGLTAYRLEFARKRAAGLSEADAAAAAQQFAVQTLQFTMGEYSVLNRPPAWRSGIQSFMYMYKVFPTTSVQMFMNLSRNGKVGMLAGLWLLTGLAGLPFAEDLEDVIDTTAQQLKIASWQGARYETAKFIDSIFPGMSPYLLKGVVNNLVPADVAGRTSLGNLLPGTDILLAGANVSRGLGELAGPAPSMLLGTAQFAVDAIATPFSTTATVESTLREAPITMFRALGDSFAYLQTGAVVDRRGYVVTDEMSGWTVLTRALGFYPAAAANQYEMIRSAKRMTDYQREVVTGYRTKWVGAMMRGDRDFARQIEQAVKDWNASAKGTALEIKNFVPNSQRALREASRPAAERTLRSAPDAAERDLRQMVDLLTLN